MLLGPSAQWSPQCSHLCGQLLAWLSRYSGCPRSAGLSYQTRRKDTLVSSRVARGRLPDPVECGPTARLSPLISKIGCLPRPTHPLHRHLSPRHTRTEPRKAQRLLSVCTPVKAEVFIFTVPFRTLSKSASPKKTVPCLKASYRKQNGVTDHKKSLTMDTGATESILDANGYRSEHEERTNGLWALEKGAERSDIGTLRVSTDLNGVQAKPGTKKLY